MKIFSNSNSLSGILSGIFLAFQKSITDSILPHIVQIHVFSSTCEIEFDSTGSLSSTSSHLGHRTLIRFRKKLDKFFGGSGRSLDNAEDRTEGTNHKKFSDCENFCNSNLLRSGF